MPVPVLALAIAALALPAAAQAFGTFKKPHSHKVGASPFAVVGADFNRDGKRDLAVSNFNPPGSLTVLLGKGNGAFRKSTTIPLGGNPSGIAIGRFNSDRRPDIAVANLDGSVQVLLGKAPVGFRPVAGYASGGTTSRFVVAADFDRDGNTDLIATNEAEGRVAMLPGSATGTFGAPQLIPVGGTPTALAVTRLNRDSRPDLVAGVANFPAFDGKIVALKATAGGFAPPKSTHVRVTPFSISIADFNRDGRRDLVSADFPAKLKAHASIELLFGRPGAKFGAPKTINLGKVVSRTSSVVAADFNLDGLPDIAAVIEATKSRLTVLTNRGHRRFSRRDRRTGGFPQQITAVRLNRDPAPDLAVTDAKLEALRVFINRR